MFLTFKQSRLRCNIFNFEEQYLNMKSIAICAILLALGVSYFYMTSTSSRSPIEEQYQLFLAEYGKSVANGEEYQMRLRIFEDNLKKIEEINSSQKSFTAGVNKFADTLVCKKNGTCAKKKDTRCKKMTLVAKKNVTRCNNKKMSLLK